MKATSDPDHRRGTPKLMKLLFVALSCFFLFALPTGCNTPFRMDSYDSSANGQTVRCSVGSKFNVRLMVSVGSGTQWKIADVDSSVLRMDPNPKMVFNVVVGGLARIYTYYYLFTPVAPGNTTLHMDLVKIDTGEVLESLELKVEVK
ncbi:MAG: protease inhibitor I42 family protein [Opitutales bacterium]|jgi:hypothetical protein